MMSFWSQKTKKINKLGLLCPLHPDAEEEDNEKKKKKKKKKEQEKKEVGD